MNATDQTTLAALQELAADGVATVSVRRLAEIVGRTRATASRSLGRLLKVGHIVQLSAGRGVQSGRYRVLSRPEKPTQKGDNNATPAEGVRDLFRSSDLYGAGCLFEAAPKGLPLSIGQVISVSLLRGFGVDGTMTRFARPLWDGLPCRGLSLSKAGRVRHLAATAGLGSNRPSWQWIGY